MTNLIPFNEKLKQKHELKSIEDFRALPREFQVEPLLVLLQTLGDIEYLKDEMLLVGDHCWSNYQEIKQGPSNHFIDNIEGLCVGTVETLQQYGKDIADKLSRMKKYFPDFEDGKEILEQCAVFAKVRQLDPNAFEDEVDKFLASMSTKFYEQKYEEDSTAKVFYPELKDYIEAEKFNFNQKKESLIGNEFEEMKARVTMEKYQ